MVMLAAPVAISVGKKIAKRALTSKIGKKVMAGPPHRRRTRLLTLSQRDELVWISRHIGRTAAAERMAHYRR